MGVRVTLVELLAAMQAPALADEDWTATWALLADPDPDPAVRRAAIPLAGGGARLLGRCRVESDPAARLPVLLALGEAASGRTGRDADDARAVVAGLLAGDDPGDPP
ncbi:hypothetical protein [Streptomyces sp. RKAG293]|uniref:hypothetical protein n=1 Tax=Streptomyces sp. RKAG293 TaxID=2893403 RepID=UPI002033E353|nr:hypothetical protein [Streptomyces sp. RKAG293]MCM2423975.1 hypothetical protein [Streptomyces sp. RKAG293]